MFPIVLGIGSLLSGLGGALSAGLTAVSGALSGALSGASAFLGKAFTGVSGILGKIGFGAKGILNRLGSLCAGPLGKELGTIVESEQFKIIKEIALEMAKKYLNKEDTIEDIGCRIIEASKPENKDWLKPKDFPTFEEYYDYLKKQIPNDKLTIDKENKLGYEATGISGVAKVVSEKENISITSDFLIETARSKMEPQEVYAIIDAFKNLGYDNVAIKEYFAGEGSPEERKRIYEALLASLQVRYGNVGVNILGKRLAQMQNCSIDDVFMAKTVYFDAIKDINENGNASKYVVEN